MAQTFSEQIAFKERSKNEFVSQSRPESFGNVPPLGYGGCTLAFGLNAAHHTVSSKYHFYSAVGYYLGPATTEKNLECSIIPIRDTRTFATRQVEVSQAQGEGKARRPVLVMIADFQVAEPASMLVYSTPPAMNHSGIHASLSMEDSLQSLVQRKLIPPELVNAYEKQFGLLGRFFDQKPCTDSIFAQNVMGMAKKLPTSQDHLPLTSRSSAFWMKTKHPVETAGQHVSAVAFGMDAALAVMPLIHSHQFMDDASAVSTLDFALRIFDNHINSNAWHLQQLQTIAGAEGRTYSEGRLWDSRGKLVANMTQQCILRPHRTVKSTL